MRDQAKFEQAKAEIDLLKEQHKSGKINLCYFDEAGHDLTPPIPYAWQEKGRTIELPSSHSRRVNILGFMNLDCQLEPYVFNCSVTADVVVACFDNFVKSVSKPTYVVIDNASIHTAAVFKEKIPEWEQAGVFVRFLPSYSPELNLIEILWRFIKYQWLRFDAYKNIESLVSALEEVLMNVGQKYRITFA